VNGGRDCQRASASTRAHTTHARFLAWVRRRGRESATLCAWCMSRDAEGYLNSNSSVNSLSCGPVHYGDLGCERRIAERSRWSS
jgi:hypothetical protein